MYMYMRSVIFGGRHNRKIFEITGWRKRDKGESAMKRERERERDRERDRESSGRIENIEKAMLCY